MTKTFLAILALSLVACSSAPQTIGLYEGSFDGETFDIHRVVAISDDGGDVTPSALPLLPVLPSTGFGTGGVPTGTNYVALVQGTRVTETAWDRPNCGRRPTSGVCVAMTMQNMYAQRLTQAFVEFTSLTPTAPTTNVTFRSNAMGSATLGTSSAVGLMRYPNLTVAGAAGDRAVRYWVFRSTDPGPAKFRFNVIVKGTLL